jgi:Lrp/AsnC family leucine-responsive transcriptional regulator
MLKTGFLRHWIYFRMKPSKPALPTQPRSGPLAGGKLDSFDRKILTALVENARATNVEIAQRVGLSEAPCSRRIRRLEEDGVIRGYAALLEPEAAGIGVSAFVTLVLENFTQEMADAFTAEIGAMPEVLACHIVSGGYDAILEVVATDNRAYSDFLLGRLRLLPGVKDARTSFVMRTLVKRAGLPLLTV